jgi:hypothetical protein
MPEHSFVPPAKSAAWRVLVTNLIMQRDAHQFSDALAAAGISLDMWRSLINIYCESQMKNK